MVKLILQRFGTGRDDRFTSALQGRQQIRECLTRSSAGLDHDFATISDRFRHRFGHPRLYRPRLESGQVGLKGAIFAEEI